jgi:hypothetical protein
MALQRQIVEIPFNKGMDTYTDEYLQSIDTPALLENGVFLKSGEIRKRYGLTKLSNLLAGGGTVTTGRRVTSFSQDLTMLTVGGVYTYSPSSTQWIYKGSFATAQIENKPIIRSATTVSHADYAESGELGAAIWVDGYDVKCSVFDTDTNSTILFNQSLYTGSVSAPGLRPRVISTTTKFIFLWWVKNASTDSELRCKIVDRTQPTTLITPTIPAPFSAQENTTPDYPWDVVNYNNTACIVFISPSARKLTVGYITDEGEQGSNANSSFAPTTTNAMTYAPVNIAVVPNGTLLYIPYTDSNGSGYVAVTRYNLPGWTDTTGTHFEAMTYSAAQVLLDGQISGIAISETVTRFVSSSSTVASPINVSTKLVDLTIDAPNASLASVTFTVGAPDTKSQVVLASRPFVYEDVAYFLTSYQGSTTDSLNLQPTYFILDEDFNVAAKILSGIAGGHIGHCPTPVVSATGVYSIPTLIRLRLTSQEGRLLATTGLSRAIVDFTQSDFTTAQLGENLHISGGYLNMYDGAEVVEHGFHLYPEVPTATLYGGGSFKETSGSLSYSWLGVYEWIDSRGQVHVSAPSSPLVVNVFTGIDYLSKTFTDANVNTTSNTVTITAHGYRTGQKVRVSGTLPSPLAAATDYWLIKDGDNTVKFATSFANALAGTTIDLTTTGTGTINVTVQTTGDTAAISFYSLPLTKKTSAKLVLYRTLNNGTTYYRVTDQAVTGGVITFYDTGDGIYTDGTIDSNQLLYTTGGVLENIAAPACKSIARHNNRLWVAGLEDENSLWFSKESVLNEGVQLSDLLQMRVNPAGGGITALASLDDKLVIFKEDTIYVLAGQGPNDLGTQSDFQQPQQVTSHVGCSNPESIAVVPDGLMFQSEKGIFLLDRGLNVKYTGSAVDEFKNLTVTSAVGMPDQNQIRLTTNGHALVYQHELNFWSVFSNYEALSASIWKGQYALLRTDGFVYIEDSTVARDAGRPYSMKLETAWIRGTTQGRLRLFGISLLGKLFSNHVLRIRKYKDYDENIFEQRLFRSVEELDNSYFGDETYWGTSTVFGAEKNRVYQFTADFDNRKCEAFKLVLEDIPVQDVEEGASYSLSSLSIEVGIKTGLHSDGKEAN